MIVTYSLKNELLKKYINYYYVDINHDNETNVYDCFPHYNNTISVYKSHKYIDNQCVYIENGEVIQIFTPIREDVLQVKQVGNVQRFVIVFLPFGINQFIKDIDFSEISINIQLFSEEECSSLFESTISEKFSSIIESILLEKIEIKENLIVESAVEFIFAHYDNFSVNELSNYLGYSRKHINRVFKENIGISIKKFHEIVLFRKTVDEKLFQTPTDSYTSISHKFNFTDQSHFNRLYKKMSSETPSQFYKNGRLIGNKDTFWRIY